MTTSHESRVAAAPISWGACEVPGGGDQPDSTRVLEEAIPQGLGSPLGQGDVDVQASVTNLEENGYEGWYVIEQGIMLDGEPQVERPIAEVRSTLEHPRRVAP